MPIYEFECPSGTITAKLVEVSTKEIKCPKCHQKATKIISPCTFKLKGGGWYADGYSSKKEKGQSCKLRSLYLALKIDMKMGINKEISDSESYKFGIGVRYFEPH